ncbi:hypothetical protein D3C87_1179280 [compost metagenome]
MGRQQSGDIGFHALFQLSGQRQAPIIEQMIIDIGWPMFSAARVADQQNLPALFQPLELAFLIAILNAGRVAAAKAIRLAM